MARLPRYAMPGQPQHVIHRGNNRSAIFAEAADYEHFRRDLVIACARYGCFVHAYVLMTNHFHLLMTAPVAHAVGKAMQCLGRRYVGYFNRRHRRTGTLWEGRYRSVPIDCERYLFTCYRYIEQNPVRAGIVADPGNYRWSSFQANAMGRMDPVVTPHERYLALAGPVVDRLAVYRAICAVPFDGPTLDAVRWSTHGGWALGDGHFCEKVTISTGRRAAPRKSLPRATMSSRRL
jgi:putative transposase